MEFASRGENESRDKWVTMEMEDVSRGHDECGSNVGIDNLQMFRDIYFWEIPVSDQDQIKIVKRGSNNLQNKEGPLKLMQGKIIKK